MHGPVLLSYIFLPGFGFATENDFVTFYQSGDAQVQNVLGGICFQGVFPDNNSVPVDLEYKIRLTAEQYGQRGGGVRFVRASSWLTSGMYPFSLSVGPRNRGSTDGGAPGEQTTYCYLKTPPKRRLLFT